MSDEKKKSFTPFGLSWPLCLGFIIIVAAGVMTGSLSTDLAGGFAFMLALGIICNEIGERIPLLEFLYRWRSRSDLPRFGLSVYK